jgi:hypothetical protein
MQKVESQKKAGQIINLQTKFYCQISTIRLLQLFLMKISIRLAYLHRPGYGCITMRDHIDLYNIKRQQNSY